MAKRADWDPAKYESGHAFVWEYGASLLEVLGPQPGERILDLGCGTGHLTAKIADSGATVVGIDSSPAMVAQARQNFPQLTFHLVSAESYRTDVPFDAVFSNAALHWISDQDSVSESICMALKPGGRFVAELGAKGNIAEIDRAIRTQIHNFFPSVGEYTSILERHGLEVVNASVFDRPTPLENGDAGMREWLATFRPDNARPVEEVEAELRPKLFRDGRWVADYRRLRVVAKRVS